MREFGETVLFLCSAGDSDETTTSWGYGVWLGRRTQPDEHFVGTEDNVCRTRSVRRPPEESEHDLKLLETVGSTPWATRRIGEPPTSDIVLPFPMPPLPSGGPTQKEQTTKEQTGDSKTATTTVNVETGGVHQEGGASGSGATRGTTRTSDNDGREELPPQQRERSEGRLPHRNSQEEQCALLKNYKNKVKEKRNAEG